MTSLPACITAVVTMSFQNTYLAINIMRIFGKGFIEAFHVYLSDSAISVSQTLAGILELLAGLVLTVSCGLEPVKALLLLRLILFCPDALYGRTQLVYLSVIRSLHSSDFCNFFF